MEKEIKVLNFAYRASYQIFVYEEDDEKLQRPPIGWGSGFFFEINGLVVFITADHVVHTRDHEEAFEARTQKRNNIGIICGKNKDLSTMVASINNFSSIDVYSKDGELYGFYDITMSYVNPFSQDVFKSWELVEPETQKIIVNEGEDKIVISLNDIDDLRESDDYFIIGRNHNNAEGALNYCENVLMNGLTYQKSEKGYAVLSSLADVSYTDWAGLSGSPVFNQDGKVVGMLSRVSEQEKTVTIIPMTIILQYYGLFMKMELAYYTTMR